MKSIVSSAALIAVLATANVFAEDEVPGPEVGDEAPSFKLKDQEGKERSLESLLKKRNVALIFYRSADW